MQDLAGKRLLVLGGSLWREAIQKSAREMGISIISAGLYPAGIDDIADEVYRIDTTDASFMIPFIREKKIDGVYLGGSELIISSACHYLQQLNMPCYCTPFQWDSLMNKKKFKDLCVEFKLPVTETYDVNTQNIQFPVVVKPVDGCGSSGLSFINKREELMPAVFKAKSCSATKDAIIERYVKNIGYCVFYTFIDGKAVFSGMEAKLPIYYENHKSYVGGLYYFTNKREKIFRDKYEEQLIKLFNKIGLNAGSLWIEVFYDKDSFYFNEVGFRPGGEVSQYPVNYYTGINQVAQDIYYALTGSTLLIKSSPLVKRSNTHNYAIYPVHICEGRIKTIDGITNLENLDPIKKVFLTKKEGDSVTDSGTFSQICALVHFVYDKIEDIECIIKEVNKLLTIRDVQNTNMIRNKLYESVNGCVTGSYRGGAAA